MIKALNFLKISGFKYAVSTTSPKPRVPVCIETARLTDFFPEEKVHSGFSDFDPPKYKPAPDVYIKAAAAEEVPVDNCIAVEDSVSGVGSAANAKIGLIVGYVGGSHIPYDRREEQAKALMKGGKSIDRRGADIVITDMTDLPTVANFFLDLKLDCGNDEQCLARPYDFSQLGPSLVDKIYTPEFSGAMPEAEDVNPR